LLARRFGLAALTPEEEKALVASLDEAEHDIDNGRHASGEQMRDALHSWTGK
jgi:hypothetical protein